MLAYTEKSALIRELSFIRFTDVFGGAYWCHVQSFHWKRHIWIRSDIITPAWLELEDVIKVTVQNEKRRSQYSSFCIPCRSIPGLQSTQSQPQIDWTTNDVSARLWSIPFFSDDGVAFSLLHFTQVTVSTEGMHFLEEGTAREGFHQIGCLSCQRHWVWRPRLVRRRKFEGACARRLSEPGNVIYQRIATYADGTSSWGRHQGMLRCVWGVVCTSSSATWVNIVCECQSPVLDYGSLFLDVRACTNLMARSPRIPRDAYSFC